MTFKLDCTCKVKLIEDLAMRFQLKVNILEQNQWEFIVEVVIRTHYNRIKHLQKRWIVAGKETIS